MQIVPRTTPSYDPSLLVGQILNPTQNYAVVAISYECHYPNVFFEKLDESCKENGYVLLKSDATRSRIQVLLHTPNVESVSTIELERTFGGMARTFADNLSSAMEEVQDDAIVWWHRISIVPTQTKAI